MKLKFIKVAKGRDWKVGDTADFNEKDDVAMSYARKYVNNGWAEEVPATAPAPAPATAAKDADKKDGDKAK